jgi:putative membrane protein
MVSSKILEPLLIFLRGLFMGSADIIPGVSGGTIALITGIYERLVHAIGKLRFSFIKPLLKLDFSEFIRLCKEEIDYKLFIPLLLGIAIAMLTLSKVIGFLLDYYPAFTFAFFLGLILASSYVLYSRVVHFSPKIIIISVIGFVLSFIFVGLNPIAANHSLPVLFFSGMIAICAMILPGISGAFILLLLGQYHYMLNALNTFNIIEIVTFCAGALIGILGFSKVLDYLLQHHEEITLALLIGVMVGTLRIPFDQITANIGGSLFELLLCAVLIILGFALIVLLEMKFKYIE